ncbi:MAG: SDR family oxidoreductase [Acetilactobacillus jinshanensis]
MNKTWIVTGCHTGFGKCLATLLAQEKNVNLVATARQPKTQLNYLDPYNHGQILKAQLDVTDNNQIESLVKLTKEKFGRIDVLVNNAGYGIVGTYEETSIKAAKKMFDTDVWGLTKVTKEVLPIMRAQKSGAIVDFSSMSGLNPFLDVAYYTGAKYAVEGMNQVLAREVKPSGIKVMMVEPSAFRTHFAKTAHPNLTHIKNYKFLNPQMKHMAERAGDEKGDPKKAAKIIYDQVTNHFDTLPLQLPLGSRSVNGTIDHLKDELNRFRKLRKLASSADYTDNK